MSSVCQRTVVLLSLMFGMAPLQADDLESIESDLAQRIARRLLEETARISQPQIAIDAQADQANGVHIPRKAGVLLIPQKDFKEGEQLATQFKTEKGASLAYLFLYHVTPVVDGRPLDENQMRSITIEEDNGTQRKIHLVLLAVKQFGEGDYRLQGYGTEPKPILEAKFAEAAGRGDQPVVVEIKDVNASTQQGALTITAFGKYQAKLTCAYKVE